MIGYEHVASSLTNLRLGPEGYKVELKAKVKEKVKVGGLWFYNIWSDGREGYSGGDGGVIRVVVQVNGVGIAKWVYRPKNTPYLVQMNMSKVTEVVGDVTITWENVDITPEVNWASINAMKLVTPPTPSFSRPKITPLPKLSVYYKGKPYLQDDKALIWDFVDDNGNLLDVGYNYYEVWSKVPRALGMVRQNVGINLGTSFREIWVLVQGGGVGGNSCCIVEGDFGRRLGVVDYSNDDCLENVFFEGEHFGTWLKYTFDSPISPSSPSSPFTVRFLCDSSPGSIGGSHLEPTVWPIRKGVLSFGSAEMLTKVGEGEVWVGWSYWGKDDLRLSTLPLRFV